MNDAVWPWFWALSVPLNSHVISVYGSLTPSTGNGFPSASVPASLL